jgi:hypothetical protein
MPDFGWVLIVFLGFPLGLLFGIKALVKRSAQKFNSDNAVAEAFADPDHGTFALEVPANSAELGVFVHYNVQAVRTPGGTGRYYGLCLRLDVERADFEQKGEYLIGDAQAQVPFREVEQRQSLDGSLIRNVGMDVMRTILVARVPPGAAFRVSGKVKRTAGEGHSVLVFAKPPPG